MEWFKKKRMKIERVCWLRYGEKSTARTAYGILRNTQLGGPGKIELRYCRPKVDPKIDYRWWVVLYNIVASTRDRMSSVYGIPKAPDYDLWSITQYTGLLKRHTRNSRLLGSFYVPANVEGLLRAAQEMDELPYISRPDEYNILSSISCRDEANRRLIELGHQPTEQGKRESRVEREVREPIESEVRKLIETVYEHLFEMVNEGLFIDDFQKLGKAAVQPLIDELSLNRIPNYDTSVGDVHAFFISALGAIGDKRACPAIIKELERSDDRTTAMPRLWCRAAWALGKLGCSDARPILQSRLKESKDPNLVEVINEALAALGID